MNSSYRSLAHVDGTPDSEKEICSKILSRILIRFSDQHKIGISRV